MIWLGSRFSRIIFMSFSVAGSMRSMAIAGDVLLSVGAATAVGGLVWLLLTRRANASAAASHGRFSLGAFTSQGFGIQGRVVF